MTQPNILELAKQGDAKAIALLLNRQLQAKGITAAASLKDGCLQVMLEAAEAPSQQILAPWASKSIAGLGAASIEKVKVYGRQTGAKVPAWSQEFEVAGQKLPVADVTEGRASYSDNTESNQLSLKERAKLGDVEAIASLLNLPLQNKGITATASLQDGCLQVMLESDVVPDEEVSIRVVRRELTNLKAGAIASVKVYGQQAGEDFPAWNREFELKAEVSSDSKKLSTDKFANKPEILTQVIQLMKQQKFQEVLEISKNHLQENPQSQKILLAGGVIVLAALSFKGIPIGQQTPLPTVVTSSSAPSPTSDPVKDSATKFMEQYLDDIVNKGNSGTSYWCSKSQDFASSFFAPRNVKILDMVASDTTVSVTIQLDSSNKGGGQITNNWLIFLDKEEDQTKSSTLHDGWCVAFISDKSK
ncbi:MULTISPECIES: hypothetical protein [unclassified Microcoleus]|uniref:hypothetical protein n=1 Tax=unclassified Microcoleus TaxID=2642155 RepID=UPI002FCED6AF